MPAEPAIHSDARPRRRDRRERGTAMVELALTLPLLMALVVGIIDVGDALNAYISVVNASRDGARLAARGNATDGQVSALLVTDLSNVRNNTGSPAVTIAHDVVTGQPSIRVQACINHRLLVSYPLLPVPNPIHLCAATTMRVLTFS